MTVSSKAAAVTSKRDVCIGAVLTFVTLWLYWPLRHYGFINFDDPFYVSNNPHVLSGLTWPNIKWAFTTFANSNWHPLTWLSHMLDCQIFGVDPSGHHFTNILLHVANTLLLFVFLRLCTGSPWRSAVVAALFAWHPLHVESVAWISERKDVLSTFFGLLSVGSYVAFLQQVDVKRKRYYVMALTFYTLSLLSKPMLVTLPVLLVLLQLWPLKRIEMADARLLFKSVASVCLELLPFFVLTLVFCAITVVAQKAGGAVAKLEVVPLHHRVLNAFISYASYLRKAVWPSDLSVFYPPRTNFAPVEVIISIALLIGVTLFVVHFRRRASYLVFGWLWYVVTLVPVIGLVQVGDQAMADRYSYVPLIGIFIAVVWGVADVLASSRCRRLSIGVLVSIPLFLYGAFTTFQIDHWRNSISLFLHALDLNERNAVAHNNLGIELSALDQQTEAIRHYRRALELNANNPLAHFNLANSLNVENKTEEAIDHYKQAISLQPDYWKAHYTLAVTLDLQGHPGEAEQHLREAIRFNPNYFEAHSHLGNLLFRQRKVVEAVAELEQALKIQPQEVDTEYSLANALAQLNDLVNAIKHYRNILQNDPKHTATLNDLAWILATQAPLARQYPTEPIDLAKLACSLTQFREVRPINTLAVAYAATGQLKEAIEVGKQAAKLASMSNNEQLAAQLNQQVEKWQSALSRSGPLPPR